MSNAYKAGGLLAGIVAAASTVAMYGVKNSVGEQIPDARAEMRTQGAQGEAVKAGEPAEKAQTEIKKVETHGGDKGMKEMKS